MARTYPFAVPVATAAWEHMNTVPGFTAPAGWRTAETVSSGHGSQRLVIVESPVALSVIIAALDGQIRGRNGHLRHALLFACWTFRVARDEVGG